MSAIEESLEEGGARIMVQAPAMAPAMKTTLRPLHDRVFVKRLEEQDETRGRRG